MNKPFLEEVNKATAHVPFFSMVVIPCESSIHFHEEIEIVLILKGEVELRVGKEQFHASSGDICIIMPNQIHSFNSHDHAVFYTFKINWNISSTHANFSKYRILSPVIKHTTGFNKKLYKYFALAIEEHDNRKVGTKYVLSACANMMLAEILRAECLVLKEDIMDDINSKKHNLILSVNAYIDENYAAQISSCDVAEHLNYSKYYFMHLFKEATGTTFTAFLTEYRLKKATDLLLRPNKKTYIIAEECGFTNIRSFYKAFKEKYGMTPKEWIKRI